MNQTMMRILGTTGRIGGGLAAGVAFGMHSPHKVWFIIGGLTLAIVCSVAEWKMSK